MLLVRPINLIPGPLIISGLFSALTSAPVVSCWWACQPNGKPPTGWRPFSRRPLKRPWGEIDQAFHPRNATELEVGTCRLNHSAIFSLQSDASEKILYGRVRKRTNIAENVKGLLHEECSTSK